MLLGLQNGERDRKRISESIQKAQSLLARGRSGLGQDPAELPKGFDKELARLEVTDMMHGFPVLLYLLQALDRVWRFSFQHFHR